MPLTIPLRSDLTHYDLQVILDGLVYTLEFRWNTRESSWYMDIKTEDETLILASIKVVIDTPLGKRCADARMPPGVLLAQDSSDAKIEAGVNDLGARVILLYFEASELPVVV